MYCMLIKNSVNSQLIRSKILSQKLLNCLQGTPLKTTESINLPTETPPQDAFGIIDCHMHLIGAQQQFPFSPGHQDKFPPYTGAQYLKQAQPLGISHCVITQTPFYGVDNRNLLHALNEMREKARGIAVIDQHLSEQSALELQQAGVVGANFYLVENGELDWHCVAPANERIQSLNWQTQLQFNGNQLSARYHDIVALQGNIVIDHIGKFQPSVSVDDVNFKALCKLLDSGRCYVKLSAAYESSTGAMPYTEDAGSLAQFLITHYADFLIWGSNWPHLGLTNPADWPDPQAWLDCLALWGADTKTQQKILTSNAKKLFSF